MQIKWRYTTVLCTIATGKWGVHDCDDAKLLRVHVCCVYCVFGTIFRWSRCSGLVHSAATLFCIQVQCIFTILLHARQTRINYESQSWQRKPNFLIPFSTCVHSAYCILYTYLHKPTIASATRETEWEMNVMYDSVVHEMNVPYAL